MSLKLAERTCWYIFLTALTVMVWSDGNTHVVAGLLGGVALVLSIALDVGEFIRRRRSAA